MNLRLLSVAGLVALTSAFVVAGCNDDDGGVTPPASGGASKGGGAGKGGSTSTAGKGGGGMTGTAGDGAAGEAEGGSPAGGSPAGGAGAGGASGSAGHSGTAGSGGAAAGSGGTSGSGGKSGSGGTSGSGGKSGAGGTSGSGGTAAGSGGTAGIAAGSGGTGGTAAGSGGTGGTAAGSGGTGGAAAGSGGSGGSGGGATNLIPDGDFEAGKGAWGSNGFTTAAAVSTTVAHGGLQSLMAGTASMNALIGRDILPFVAATKKYTATAYAQVTDGTTTLKFQVILRCNGDADDSYPGIQFVNNPTINTWIPLTGTVDLSACTTIEKLQLFVGKDVGDVYVDDVSLVLQP